MSSSTPIAYAPLGHSKLPYPRLNIYYIVIILVCLSVALYFLNGVQMSSDDFSESARMPSFAAGDDFISRLIDLSYLTVNIPDYDYSKNPTCNSSQNTTPAGKAEALRTEYRQCSEHILLRFWGDDEALLLNFPTTMYVCDQEPNIQHIPIQPFTDNDGVSTFWAALPNCKDDSNILIKVGESTEAEKMLEKRVGALTVHEIGRDEKDHTKYFLDLKGDKPDLLLDMMWINQNADISYDTLVNDGQFFENNNITICQMMLKIGGPKKQQPVELVRFRGFLQTAHRASKFISMRAGIEKHDVTTTFFLNTRDQRCIDKYLS